jgi:hypothetical protein
MAISNWLNNNENGVAMTGVMQWPALAKSESENRA